MIPATMEYMNIVQLLGYSASFIIFISLTMKSIVKLRILNAMGCLLFVIFALKTHSLPAVVMNIGIVLIDIYYFFKIVRVKDNFEILEVIKENEIVRYFFEKNKDCSLLCCYVYSHRNRTEAIDASCVATVQPPFHRYDCHVYKAAARDVHVLPFDINNNGK